ncbi:hypothetical protein ACTJJ0_22255 [Chitinophaga sp. 22321]|uniref:hypothetical protein n=1 Tax=Chitinophaga sp. 22321 TaxID=3453909 RepID=UPI003F87EE42
MDIEMPPELLEAMQNLDGKHWDDIIKLWRKGEAEKKEYADLYYKQVDSLNQGNRTFQERKRMLVPDERNAEIDQSLLSEVQKRVEADLEKSQPQEPTTEERATTFAEAKNSIMGRFLKYSELEKENDRPSDKDIDDPDKGDDLDKD